MISIVSIIIGASIGALLRFGLGLSLNALFPTLPLGTLCANLLGGFLIGVVIAIIRQYGPLPQPLQLAIVTGFLGSLTTFSTFSAEAVNLLSLQEHIWFSLIIISHVGGSILSTILGIYCVRFL
jgi:CrcB protein